MSDALVSAPLDTAGGDVTDTQQVRRRAILEVAARLFSERSYHGATMKDIAAEVGINAATVYYYFRSKEEIFLRIMHQGLDEHLEGFQAVLDRETAPEARLFGLVEAYLAQTVLRPYTGLYNRYAHLLPTDAREELARRRGEVDRVVAEVLQQCAAAALDPREVALARLFLLGALNSAAYWYRPDGELNIEQVSGHFGRFVLRMLDDASPQAEGKQPVE